jgi:hypothetical protein
MIVIPKEIPIIGNLNSYYIQIERLIEHFQGEVGCGSLYFKSLSSEGTLFFDKDEILNGVYCRKNEEITGSVAINRLIETSGKTNYSLNVYILRAEDIYFWSNIPDAKRIYQDLTTEFTDLEGLIKKMKSEGLTGFIEAVIGEEKGGGLIFINNGQITGGSYSWGQGDSFRSTEDQKQLIQLTKDHGGSFHVSRIPMIESELVEDADIEFDAEEISDIPSTRIITAMEEMIAIFERTIKAMKISESEFATLLNRKFVEKADRFPFLDPFAAEFKYADKKITFDGNTTNKELTLGVIESINELADELNATNKFKANLVTWIKKYDEEVTTFEIRF